MIAIIYEDNHLIIVNKKATELVQGDITGDVPLLEKVRHYLKQRYNKPGNVFVGLPHRLDRPTSGVVVFAKTSKALSRMNAIFRSREVQKTYWAVVKNKPKEDDTVLVNYLKKSGEKNKSFVEKNDKNGAKFADLHYKLICSSDRFHLLAVTPNTGRHHQIRLQLSAIGSPIKGDLKYGSDRSNKDGSIHLHARKIEFIHPIKKEVVSFEAPVPDEQLWNVFRKLLQL
ncbi:RluA family pseudouridine synthase [Salibacteraceae bacterium]|nr:RluA family pseudouridine synthase [Salibacteraceae bacterium]